MALVQPELQNPRAEVDGLILDRFLRFLRNFTDQDVDPMSSSRADTRGLYARQVDRMQEEDETTMYVDFGDLMACDDGEVKELAGVLLQHYYQFEPVLRRAVYQLVKETNKDFADEDGEAREFFVSFYNIADRLHIRDLKTDKIGQLVAFTGTVTRTSEVRPELLYGVFTCEECGTRTGPIEQQFKYTEPAKCAAERCANRTRWKLDVQQSRFVDWQHLRVQENTEEIPPGSMPRSIDVVVRNAAVEMAKAGDKCVFTGTFVVVPDVAQLMRPGMAPRAHTRRAGGEGGGGGGGGGRGDGVTGLKALGVRDLTYRTSFVACSVETVDTSRTDNAIADSETDKEQLWAMAQSQTLYDDLAASIAPTVFDHPTVKRGILLQLLGGIQKNTKDGIRLRGDINVCIVGDPATAKSQFLKYVSRFAPRAVYTSGKASSAAGLTASVVKDRDTGEFTIEAGALMLADNGICCIDEFDKMDPKDQVAIHEAMEQQTISITKAGIQATLNARTSILAAANPIYGRYDKSKPLRQNISLSAAIMSRFDLFFVVLDEMSPHIDEAVAKHIVAVHRRQPTVTKPKYSMERMQRYIRFARTFEPRIGAEAKKAIVLCYQKLRQNDVVGATQASYRITVRQLESLIRLSEALARLQLKDTVEQEHVYEAHRLLHQSIIRVQDSHIDLSDIKKRVASSITPGGGDDTAGGAPAGGDGDADLVNVTITEADYKNIQDEIEKEVLRQKLEDGKDAVKESDLVDRVVEAAVEEKGWDETNEEDVVQHQELVRAVLDRMLDAEGTSSIYDAQLTADDGDKYIAHRD